MYLFSVLFKSGQMIEFSTGTTKYISDTANFLENSPDVKSFKVIGSGGILMAKHFGFGDFNKWVEQHYYHK